MAKLPGYDSQVGMTTEAPTKMRSLEAEGQMGRNFQVAGKAAKDIAMVWQEAKDLSETLAEKNKIDTEVTAIMNEAVNDPKHDNPEDYKSKLEEARGKVGEFSNNQNALKFREYSNNAIAQAGIKIDGVYRKKMIDHSNGEVMTQDQINHAKYIAGDLTKKKEQKDIIDAARNRGLAGFKITAERLEKLEEWEGDRALYDAKQGNADAVLALIKKGGYYDIPPEREAKIIEQIGKVDKINKAAEKKFIRESQIKNELGLLKEFQENGIQNLDVDKLAQMVKDEAIRPKFAEVLGKYMLTPRVYKDAAYDDPNFNGYIEAILNSKNKENIEAVLEGALDKAEVAESDLAIMIGLATAKSGTLISLDENSGDEGDTGLFDKLKGLLNWGKDKPNEKSQMIRSYEEKIKEGKNPAQAMKAVQSEIMIKNNPALQNIPEGGVILPDKYGNKARVFPDGHYEPVK